METPDPKSIINNIRDGIETFGWVESELEQETGFSPEKFDGWIIELNETIDEVFDKSPNLFPNYLGLLQELSDYIKLIEQINDQNLDEILVGFNGIIQSNIIWTKENIEEIKSKLNETLDKFKEKLNELKL